VTLSRVIVGAVRPQSRWQIIDVPLVIPGLEAVEEEEDPRMQRIMWRAFASAFAAFAQAPGSPVTNGGRDTISALEGSS